jgi:hypothetical protein
MTPSSRKSTPEYLHVTIGTEQAIQKQIPMVSVIVVIKIPPNDTSFETNQTAITLLHLSLIYLRLAYR